MASAPLTPFMSIDLCPDFARARQIRSRLRSLHEQLFIDDVSKVLLKFLESPLGNPELKSYEIKSIDDLERHLAQYRENGGECDPGVRHVFFSAGNSQKPLRCTPECYYALSRHHQVPREFEDMILSFGKPAGEVVGFHQPRCHLEIRPSSEAETPSYEMKNCYKVSAMEPSTTNKSWVMRQMAVFHSLDLDSGRSFTLTVKANNRDIADRIKSLGDGIVPSTISQCLNRSLETQLVSLSWCVEGWMSHIGALESEIREVSMKINGLPIPSGEERSLLRGLTMKTTGLGQPSSQQGSSYISAIRHWTQRLFRGYNGESSSKSGDNIQMDNIAGASKAAEEGIVKIEKVAEQQIEALKEFPFNGLQALNSAIAKLREAKLVMELNRLVLQDVREHYRSVFDSREISPDIKQSCGLAHLSFQQRIKYLEKLLVMECLRVDTLTQMAGDGNSLYGSILQVRSGQISQLLTIDARAASARMESMTQNMHEIAHNTERDTSSMHVMTFFALVFLPGTFLGSFFSTPIFEGKAPDGSSSWTFNREIFALFAKICFPMMFVTLLLWGLWTLQSKHRRVQREKKMARKEMC